MEVPGLRPGWDMFVLVCSVIWLLSDVLNGWPHDHGPTNVGAMVKIEDNITFQQAHTVLLEWDQGGHNIYIFFFKLISFNIWPILWLELNPSLSLAVQNNETYLFDANGLEDILPYNMLDKLYKSSVKVIFSTVPPLPLCQSFAHILGCRLSPHPLSKG